MYPPPTSEILSNCVMTVRGYTCIYHQWTKRETTRTKRHYLRLLLTTATGIKVRAYYPHYDNSRRSIAGHETYLSVGPGRWSSATSKYARRRVRRGLESEPEGKHDDACTYVFIRRTPKRTRTHARTYPPGRTHAHIRNAIRTHARTS